MADHPELVPGPYLENPPLLVPGLYLQSPPLSVRTAGLFERSRGPAETFDV